MWYVLTPAGKAGPFKTRSEASAEAGRFGWVVLREAPTSTDPVCDHAVDNPHCEHYS